MVNALTEVEGAILDAKKAVEEFDNAILALHVEIFERIQNQFSSFNNELSNMSGLFKDFDVADKSGEWTDEGLAQLGLAAQQYELAKYQVEQYNKEIEDLNQKYREGKYSTTEYIDRLIELKENQWDAVNASEAAKEAIKELNEARINIQIEGIEEEIDAFKKLTDEMIEALEAEKSLHDYQRSITESAKEVAKIEKQLAALRGDDSAAAKAKRAKLEEQLKEAQDELAEKEYQHSIETQKEALQKQAEDFEEMKNKEIEDLRASLEDIEALMIASFETIKENASIIGQEIADMAAQHNIEISDALISAWDAGENAIASYGETLTAGASQFITNLQGVELETWELQNQANQTSVGLAAMFGNRADTLIGELLNSYNNTQALDFAAQALRNSYANAFGPYDVSGIVGALNQVANAANNAAAAARNAAAALAEMGAAQSNVGRVEMSGGKFVWYAPDGSVQVYDTMKDLQNARGYATGLKKADQDQLAWTQELGEEAIISPTRNAILTPIRRADSVLDAKMTDNLWKWAEYNPNEFLRGMRVDAPQIPMSASTETNNSMNVGSLIQVNGPVNDSVEMMKIAAVQASKIVTQSFKKINDGLHK